MEAAAEPPRSPSPSAVPERWSPAQPVGLVLKRTPSGMLIRPEGPSPQSFCRSHSGLSLKRKCSPGRHELRKRIALNVEIPTSLILSPSNSHQDLASPRTQLSEHQAARDWVRGLGQGIRVLAVDFDATCVSVDTRGHWRGSVAGLAARFRPVMRQVILEACTIGLRVAVVSFSAQVSLISEVLAAVFPEQAGKIILRAGAPRSIQLKTELGGRASTRNKQRHICAVLEELQYGHDELVGLDEVMLIDDDFRNVEDARTGGCHAVWFNPEIALSFACDLCQSRDHEHLEPVEHICGHRSSPRLAAARSLSPVVVAAGVTAKLPMCRGTGT